MLPTSDPIIVMPKQPCLNNFQINVKSLNLFSVFSVTS
jgi:hypothetical protein